MNGADLFQAIGNIDERYITELEVHQKVARFSSKKLLSTACLVLLLLSSGVIYQVTRTPSVPNHSPMLDSNASTLTNIRFGENGITEYEVGSDIDYIHITYKENDYYLIERISAFDVSDDFCTELILIEEIEHEDSEYITTSEDNNFHRDIYYDTINDRIVIFETSDTEIATYLICSPH